MEGKHVLSGRAGENVNGGGRRGRGGENAESILYNSKFAKYHGNTKSLKADAICILFCMDGLCLHVVCKIY